MKNRTRDISNQKTEEPTQLFYILRDNVFDEMSDQDKTYWQDINFIKSFIKEKVYVKFPELELIEQMTKTDPKSRITIENAIERWKELGKRFL